MKTRIPRPLILTLSVALILVVWFILSDKPGRVSFDAGFESGSIGNTELMESKRVKDENGKKFWHLTYKVTSQRDPANPVDTALKASGRWFYFRMVGVKDKEIELEFENSDPVAPVYSYDNKHFERFPKDTFVKHFTKDTVYVSYYVPYTFAHLQQRFSDWRGTGHVVRMDTIGWSYQERPLQMMTITDPAVRDEHKKRIYIHGRIHPSETPASWHLDSMIDELVSDSPLGESFRRQAVFYILPFVNPDGVVAGMSRSNSKGVNMEINYDRPDSLTAKEVAAIKRNMKDLTATRPLDMLLNMHTQSIPRVSYWIHTDSSTSATYYRQQLLLANLTIARSDVFHRDDLQFSNSASRYIEGQTWNRFRTRTLAITFETPYTYYNDNPDGTWVTLENLKELGVSTLKAVGDYYRLSSPECYYLDPVPTRPGEWHFLSSDKVVFMGSGYYEAKRKGAIMRYSHDNLPAGKYALYKWKPGFCEQVSLPGENEWQKMEEFEHKGGDYWYSSPALSQGARENGVRVEAVSTN